MDGQTDGHSHLIREHFKYIFYEHFNYKAWKTIVPVSAKEVDEWLDDILSEAER